MNLFDPQTPNSGGGKLTALFANRGMTGRIVLTDTLCNDVAKICAIKTGTTSFGAVLPNADSLAPVAVPLYKGGKMQKECILPYFTLSELMALLPSVIKTDMQLAYTLNISAMPNGGFTVGYLAGNKWLCSFNANELDVALCKLLIKVDALGVDLRYPEYDATTVHPLGGAASAANAQPQVQAPLTVAQVSNGQLHPGVANTIDVLKETLAKFRIAIDNHIEVVNAAQVTKFLVRPRSSTKVKDLINLSDDLAVALKVESCVISKNANGQVGIEIPSQTPKMVLASDVYKALQKPELLSIGLGKDTDNGIMQVDLANCPHLLLAGATGQGKSVGLNLIFFNLVKNCTPDEVRFLVIDPKRVELAHLNKCPQFLLRIKDSGISAGNSVLYDDIEIMLALKSLCSEMEKRYSMFVAHDVRSLKDFHKVSDIFLPYIVCVVDELADLLMSNSGRQCQEYLVKLAQKARAVGIHLVLATQRPDAKILSGALRSNIPVRISYKTVTGRDSEIIIGKSGAQSLVGNGDALILQGGKVKRFQTAYVSDTELNMAIAGVPESNKDYFI